ncbi:MAG: DNA methyltransferase [bacterium]|nr:DNA methyltransferase [bacterium]
MPNELLDRILQGDSVELLRTLPPCSIDMIFADPPYNLQLQGDLWRPNLTRVAAVDAAWDQFEGFSAYDDFTRAWLKAAHGVLKDTGTIWVSGTYHNIFRVGAVMQDLGYWVLNTIIWHKPNAMPNFRGTRLKNDVEFVIWAKKSPGSTYTFQHHTMKQYNQGKQLGSVWSIPVCSGAERLRDAAGKKLHPTQKPEALIERILTASTRPGDVVLDPFLGSGTTAAVARRLHRRWIGIEREAVYIEAAQRRIDSIIPLAESDPQLTNDLPKPGRIAFSTLVERGLLHTGQVLRLDQPRLLAFVRNDGQLQTEAGLNGSIHKLAAALKQVPSCNGWKHWQYEHAPGQWEPLDVLRRRYREQATEG